MTGRAAVVAADHPHAGADVTAMPEFLAQGEDVPEERRQGSAADLQRHADRAGGHVGHNGAVCCRNGRAMQGGAGILHLAPG